MALLLEYEMMSANSVFPTISQEQSGDRKSSLWVIIGLPLNLQKNKARSLQLNVIKTVLRGLPAVWI